MRGVHDPTGWQRMPPKPEWKDDLHVIFDEGEQARFVMKNHDWHLVSSVPNKLRLGRPELR